MEEPARVVTDIHPVGKGTAAEGLDESNGFKGRNGMQKQLNYRRKWQVPRGHVPTFVGSGCGGHGDRVGYGVVPRPNTFSTGRSAIQGRVQQPDGLQKGLRADKEEESGYSFVVWVYCCHCYIPDLAGLTELCETSRSNKRPRNRT